MYLASMATKKNAAARVLAKKKVAPKSATPKKTGAPKRRASSDPLAVVGFMKIGPRECGTLHDAPVLRVVFLR